MANESVAVAEDMVAALKREEVWDDFIALPAELRAEFVLWVETAMGDKHRHRRIGTLINLLRQKVT